jgi:XRE family transcriptional regulator, regulator of sulfur utilization
MNPRRPHDPQSQLALGQAIRETRKKRGETLESLASAAGLSRNMLSQIERGEGNPSWVTLRGIAAGLELSSSELTKRAEEIEE